MEPTVFPFSNSYADLPERFFACLPPSPVKRPTLIRVNEQLAEQLGLDPMSLRHSSGIEVLSGNRVPDGAKPLAMVYAGFQFGGWVPQLGDGRAILLGEIVDRVGVRRDIQLKGAGPTPFSRMGDGRAGLGPVLREYIVSEAMAALGVPTTRSLAAVLTGEEIRRETLLPGAVLTRVAASHVRIGTFQYFAARHDVEALELLADYVIKRHFPSAASAEEPYLAFLRAVIDRQAFLIANWQLLGFIHGVMNTDNMSISGETIDYGPCAFMDVFHPETVYSSIDRMGRYAYCNQPSVAHWNLAGLGQTLLPLVIGNNDDAVAKVTEIVNTFPKRFQDYYVSRLCRKLGLIKIAEGDDELAQNLLSCMIKGRADFTLTFRRLCDLKKAPTDVDDSLRKLFDDGSGLDQWLLDWRQRLSVEQRPDLDRSVDMCCVNPAFIPRNHLVERVIRSAEDHEDVSLFHELMEVLAAPYEDQPGRELYSNPPKFNEIVKQTFCGT
jgi:uncharacterized protein YdiU (UPF0061 family)